jgi:hypothetical protein
MSCFVFELSKDLFSGLVSDWLTIQEVARVDSACCEREVRIKFLWAIHFNCFPIVVPTPKEGYSNDYLRWAVIRNLPLKNLVLPNFVHKVEVPKVLSQSKFNALTHLDASQASELTDSLLCHFIDNCKLLKELDIGSENYTSKISDQSLVRLGESSLRLTKLTITQNKFISDEAFESFCTGGAACLKELCLLSCTSLGDPCILAVAQSCPDLSVLHISNNHKVSRIGLSEILKHCAKLSDLSSMGCSHLIPTVCVRGAAARPLTHLTRLAITNSSAATDASLVLFFRQCPNLTSLDLQNNQSISDVCARSIATHLKYLVVLNIDACYKISNFGMAQIVRECHMMQRLYLHACNATDDIIVLIAESCKNLTHLSVSWCRMITDPSVIALSGGCPFLQELSLNGCERITAVAIRELALHCPDLRDLYIPYCRRVTMAALTELRPQHPGLLIHTKY